MGAYYRNVQTNLKLISALELKQHQSDLGLFK